MSQQPTSHSSFGIARGSMPSLPWKLYLFGAVILPLTGCTTYFLPDAMTANSRLSYLPWKQTPSTNNSAQASDEFRVEPGMRLEFIQAQVDELKWNILTAPLSISYWVVPGVSSLEVTDYAVMGWMLESAFPLPLPDGSNPRFDPIAAVINQGNPRYDEVISSLRLNFTHSADGQSSGKAWDAAEMQESLCTAQAADYRQADVDPAGYSNTSDESQSAVSATPQAPYLFFTIPMSNGNRIMQLGGWSGWFFENPKTLHYPAGFIGNDYYQPPPQNQQGISITQLRMTVFADIPIDIKGQPTRFISPCTTVGELESTEGVYIKDIHRLARFLPEIDSSGGKEIPANSLEDEELTVSKDGRFDVAFEKRAHRRLEIPGRPYVINALDNQKCGMLLAPGDIIVPVPAANYIHFCSNDPGG